MKRRLGFALLTIISFLLVGLFSYTKDYKEASAAGEIDAEIFSVQVRSGGGENNFIVVQDQQISTSYPATAISDTSNYNAPNYIKIYMSANDEGLYLSSIIKDAVWPIHLWGSQGVMFPLSETTYQTYNASTIYAIEILEGCTYPNNKSQTIINRYTKKYINLNYGDPTHINESFDWGLAEDFTPSGENISLFGAQLRADTDADLYYVCLSSSIYFEKSQTEYLDISVLNAFNKIKLYLSENDEGKTLGEITSLTNGYQNRWGSSSFHFALTSEEYEIYNGTTIHRISVDSGCELVVDGKIYTTPESYLLINMDYGNASVKYGAFNFVPTIERDDETKLDIFTAEVRAEPLSNLFFIDLKCELFLDESTRDYSNLDQYINAYEKIKIYLNKEDEGTLLKDVTSLRNATKNLWESSAFMFALTSEEYEIYNGTTVYMIEVLEGCELLYDNKICQVNKPITFVNLDYGKASVKYEAFNFVIESKPLTEPIALMGAQVRAVQDSEDLYFIDLRSELYIDTSVIDYTNTSELNAYDHIKIYLSADDEGKTLGEITSLRAGCQNRWDSYAFLFKLTKEEYEVYNGTTIYMIEVLEGCELFVNGIKGEVDKGYQYVNLDYGKASAKYEAFNFTAKVSDLTYLGTIGMLNIHNRMDRESNQRWIMFLFDNAVFDTNLVINNWIDDTNFLDKVHIWTSKDAEPITLRSIYDDENSTGITLRQFGERNMIGVTINNSKNDNGYLYDCSHMYMIQLDADIQIPTYENGVAGYRVLTDKAVLTNDDFGKTGSVPDTLDDEGKPRIYEEWNLNWSIVYIATFTVKGLDNISFPNMNLEPGQRVPFSYFVVDGYDLTVTTSKNEKVYKCIIGVRKNVDYILTYTVHKDDGTEKDDSSETKKCGGSIIMTSVILSSISLVGIVLLTFKKKEGKTHEE